LPATQRTGEQQTKRYTAKLTEEKRGYLKALINKEKTLARKPTHARILLAVEEGQEHTVRIGGNLGSGLDLI